MAILLLALALLVALVLIPLGLPGSWVMILVGAIYGYLVPHAGIGAVSIIGCAGIAIVAELLDVAISGRYTQKYGGSRRGAWGAIIGGMIGAMVGVPIPVLGSVVGALAGSFAGALIGEFSRGATHHEAARAARGAAIGRVAAMGVKAAAGCMIAAWLLAAAII